MISQSCYRVRWHGRKQRLEPCAGKLACTVLRGEGGGNTTLLPANLGNGWNTTEVVTKYYYALGRLIAFRKNTQGAPPTSALYYVGVGHLGGTIRVADAAFAAVDQMRYAAYGGSRDLGTNLKTDHKFTGQIEDASIGLYWYGSRAYDPALGRFMVPDIIVPEPGNPQALEQTCPRPPRKPGNATWIFSATRWPTPPYSQIPWNGGGSNCPGRHQSGYVVRPQHPDIIKLDKAAGVAFAGPVISAGLQGVTDYVFDPDLSPQERGLRMFGAGVAAVPVAVVSGGLILAGAPAGLVVAVAPFGGAAADHFLEPIVFSQLGVGE